MHALARSALLRLSLAAASALGWSQVAHADTLTEDFNAPFPAWESGWFATNSDAINDCAIIYCLVGSDPVPPGHDVRGNAGSGMWLGSESGIISFPLTITFDPTFGASLTSFTLDAAVYVASTFEAWDMSGNLIFSRRLRVDSYKDVPTSRYQTLTFSSTDGIASFSFTGSTNGNTVVDNLIAVTSAVPEPTSVALLLGGLALVGSRVKRRKA